CAGPPRACVAGLAFYPEAHLQSFDIQVGFRQQPLQATVLRLELLQTLGVFGLHAAVLDPPLIEARRAEAMLAPQLGNRHAAFGLLQEGNDLFSGESTLAHVRPLWVTDFTQECVVRLNG